jgi:glycosyltransferase involved in cell wall biosynthesis
VAGAGSEALPYRMKDGMESLGHIADVGQFFDQVDVVVAPILGGGGIKVKVLEAAARGLPVVTTSAGVEGLGKELPASVDVRDEAPRFADCVCTWLRLQPDLPLVSGMQWYEHLVILGSGGVENAVLGQVKGQSVPG